MLKDLSELLRQPETVEEEMTECRRCETQCPKSAEVCPNCGEATNVPTLAEWGRQLPIGVIDIKNKTLNRDFTVRKINFMIEREISEYWSKYIKKNKEVNLLDYLPCVLAFTLETLGGENIQKFPVDRRIGIIRSMFLGDIFYVYAYLRIETLGPDFTLKSVECPECRKTFEYPVDLASLEIYTRKDYDSLFNTVELRDGFTISNKLRKKLTLMPVTFNAISTNTDNSASMFGEMLKACVCGIEEMVEGSVITDAEVNQLSKYDMSTLDSKISLVSGGPDWTIEIKCPNASCGFKWDSALDWRYGDFFGHSSRLMRRRR